MEPQALDYAGVLSKLLELLGRLVEVTNRGGGSSPPIFVDFEGKLERGDFCGSRFRPAATCDPRLGLSRNGTGGGRPGAREALQCSARLGTPLRQRRPVLLASPSGVARGPD